MTTHRAEAVARGGGAGAPDRVELDYRDRFLRRKRLTTVAGAALVVDLPETVSLDDGDALLLMGGGRIAVVAAAEPLVAVTAPDAAGLARLAWHVGNRHTPAEIGDGRLLVQRDHVIEDMLHRLGATLTPLMAPFRPEGGAYGHGRTHGHHAGGATDDPDAHAH
ncbi:MAG: urease accessory protein UreE [Amaricoccus sp.]|uniref:urease accessory protein UreE n=1 Tax=Amaricoccus sp. TaxID=1872485 RepID=UPI0039E4D7E2